MLKVETLEKTLTGHDQAEQCDEQNDDENEHIYLNNNEDLDEGNFACAWCRCRGLRNTECHDPSVQTAFWEKEFNSLPIGNVGVNEVTAPTVTTHSEKGYVDYASGDTSKSGDQGGDGPNDNGDTGGGTGVILMVVLELMVVLVAILVAILVATVAMTTTPMTPIKK